MTQAIAHRGPDDYGYCTSMQGSIAVWRDAPPKGVTAPGVAMGHRRLSILDLSEAGRQPFLSADNRYAMVYNGEVFNYKELRKELENAGVRFHTNTDTEVVLAAFLHWHTECFNRFNGMWAIVIWDRLTNSLIACRDRFGIKPLYYQQIGNNWTFASEIKAILDNPTAIKGINALVLAQYLLDFGNPRDGNTFYEQVYEVLPGTYMELTPTSTRTKRYWNPPIKSNYITNFPTLEDAADYLRCLLTDSVALRMRSDVRIGTMMSGGMDSTSVISVVRSLMDSSNVAQQATGDQLQAFSAIFRGTNIDEEPLIDEVCAYLDVNANKVFPHQQNDPLALLYTSIWHLERPYFNSVPLVHTLLMRKARSIGVKVVLNGHGPDEMLAGYPTKYIPSVIADALAGLRWSDAIHEINCMRDVHKLGRLRTLRRAINILTTRVPLLKPARARSESLSLLTHEMRDIVSRHLYRYARISSMNCLNNALHEDFFYQSLPKWLHLEDRISMSESIEARLPFLDYRIVEFAFSLPNQYKIQNGMTKLVLRKAMEKYLPQSVITHTRKVPFSGPDREWICGPLRPWLTATFLNGKAHLYDYLNATAVRELLRDFLDSPSTRTHQYQVWRFITTELWMQIYFYGKRTC